MTKGWNHRGSNIWCLCEDLKNENETGFFSVEIEKGKQAFVVNMLRPLNKDEMDSLFTLMDLLSKVP